MTELTSVFNTRLTIPAYLGYMPRFSIPMAEKPAPPPVRWTVWRVFLWTLLVTMLAFWLGAVLTP